MYNKNVFFLFNALKFTLRFTNNNIEHANIFFIFSLNKNKIRHLINIIIITLSLSNVKRPGSKWISNCVKKKQSKIILTIDFCQLRT